MNQSEHFAFIRCRANTNDWIAMQVTHCFTQNATLFLQGAILQRNVGYRDGSLFTYMQCIGVQYVSINVGSIYMDIYDTFDDLVADHLARML